MASAAPSFVAGSASSAPSHTNKYDVFISFRGEDTRTGFTSHLHKALLEKGIDTYIDYRIQKGEQVWIELVNAIKDSTLLLVIFSENYASSSWCLNELVELMECTKQAVKDVHVIPVFYRIDPSQVRKQEGSYHAAFAKHEKDGKVNKEMMQKWKNALFIASNLSGFHSLTYRTESEMIEDIIKHVLQKLNYKNANDFRSRFIYDENYTSIKPLLEIDSKEVRVIGIWGMGGIGKTTLATAIFHEVSSQYEGTCFLENVADESKRNGLKYTCNKLLSELLREDLHIHTPNLIPSFVTRRLRHKRVLIVPDDVKSSDLLENLVGAGRDWLGVGSRVIVTTRDKHVLVSEHVDKIHEVKQMNFENSLKLFCLNAFGKTYLTEKYEELSKRAISYAKGIPLALQVLGSFLHSKSESEWDSALRKLKKIPNAEIQAVMRLSYDGLDDDEKNIFLDIACFFKGQERDFITRILNACGFFADIGIRSLLDKALITIISHEDRIHMHDLVQEMGREIVRQESPKNPGQRSRLWNPEEVYDLLTNNTGTDAIEGILVDTTQIPRINLSSEAFRKMPNLRFLAFQSLNENLEISDSVYLPEGLEFLPKGLRYIGWNAYPLKSLPSTFCSVKLVELSMPYSNLKILWPGTQKLPNLVKIDLYGSKHLIECPDLSQCPNLEFVRVNGCESLSYIDPSILSRPKLRDLYISGCTSLKTLSNICSEVLESLAFFNSGLEELPPSILLLRSLRAFHCSINYNLAYLPENFSDVIWLSDSTVHECDPFSILHKVLPSPGFRTLTYLGVYKCRTLCEIPDNISLLSSLQYLILWECAIISLPESIKYLPRLIYLEVFQCNILERIPALPQSIQYLDIWNCKSLQSMLSSPIEPSKRCKCTFLLPNCINLDQHSYDAILQDFIARVELGAVLQNGECASTDNNYNDNACPFEGELYDSARSGKICYYLPTGSGKFRELFHCLSAQPLVSIELPPNLLGFVFYLVVSQVQSCQIAKSGNIGCECYFETIWGERINMTSFFVDKDVLLHDAPFEFMEDHVFLWYDEQCCKQIMEAIKERKTNIDKSTTRNPKFSFKFFARILDNEEAVIIKECGFRWLYSSEGEGCKSKRSREIHEVEANVVQNNFDGSESNEQEGTLPPTKKFKNVSPHVKWPKEK